MKFDLKIIGYINTFENLTKTNVKDCFFDENQLIFVIDEKNLGKAVGKNGENIRKLGVKIKQKIRVIGFDSDPVRFTRNLFYPLNGFNIENRNGKIVIKTEDRILKGKLYGRDRRNLKKINDIFKRYFKDLEIVVE